MTNAILLPHVIRYNDTDSPTRMGIYPSYSHPKACKRYVTLAKAIGAESDTTEGLITELKKLCAELDIPPSFKAAGIDREKFMAELDQIAEDAFDDQCTPANPRFPLIPELKDILIAAYDDDE